MVVFVIPAKAGIQKHKPLVDPGDPAPAKAGGRGDGLDVFCDIVTTKFFFIFLRISAISAVFAAKGNSHEVSYRARQHG
jgi:hypothetical protein